MTENHPWQVRAKDAGLSQRVLARLLGRPEITVSRQLRGKFGGGETPLHVISAILAWELMSAEQRQAWVSAVEAFQA